MITPTLNQVYRPAVSSLLRKETHLMKTLIIVIIILSATPCLAQTTFRGSIVNKSGEAIAGTVTIQAKGSPTIAGFSSCNPQGKYTISYKGAADSVTITLSSMLVGMHSRTVKNQSQQVDFVIDEQPLQLKGVTINALKIKQDKDTLNYLVGAYTDQSDRVIGDVLKKMPGIEVSESGKISFNGKDIKRFYVENLDLLQGRYGLATNNIPARAVSVVQVMENYQPIKALQGKIPTDDVAINLRLKDSAKGTLSVMGLLGGGYQPILWNAEATAMYFSKQRQNMTIYKGNNSGGNVASEFRTHYDYKRVYTSPGSKLSIQNPATPPIPRKRYIDNRSHAISTNHLEKIKEELELTTNVLYYEDRIKKESFSSYEQYLPSSERLKIGEQIRSVSHIHNLELASRLNANAKNHYLNNAFNLNANWNNDFGTSHTHSNANAADALISQRLQQPFLSMDNTLNLLKNVKDNTYKLYFSIGYGQKPHSLTVSPVTYWGEKPLESLTQDLTEKNLTSVLRLSYNLKLKDFRLDYNLWGSANLRNLDSELTGLGSGNEVLLTADSLRNNLWYNTYQAGVYQAYTYDNNSNFKITLKLPLAYQVIAKNNKILNQVNTYQRVNVSPALSLRYDYNDFSFYVQGAAGRNFGDMNSSYTGFIMRSYRSLLRNDIDNLFESRSYNATGSVYYKDAFHALFLNAGVHYKHSWRNLLYGYSYQDIMSVKTVIGQPTQTDNYGVKMNASKGFNFLSTTLRGFSYYNRGNSQQLIQDEILDSQSYDYGAGFSMDTTPFSFLNLKYAFSWSENKSYIESQASDFPAIRQTSQNIGINIFPTKEITINMNMKHQYNSAAGKKYTTFSDANIKWKNKHLDIELEVNNLFNTKQYITAFFDDVSTSYYSYDLRPVSALIKFRFKIK